MWGTTAIVELLLYTCCAMIYHETKIVFIPLERPRMFDMRREFLGVIAEGHVVATKTRTAS